MECNSKLDLILGPMFSGKTTKLLEIMKSFDETTKVLSLEVGTTFL